MINNTSKILAVGLLLLHGINGALYDYDNYLDDFYALQKDYVLCKSDYKCMDSQDKYLNLFLDDCEICFTEQENGVPDIPDCYTKQEYDGWVAAELFKDITVIDKWQHTIIDITPKQYGGYGDQQTVYTITAEVDREYTQGLCQYRSYEREQFEIIHGIQKIRSYKMENIFERNTCDDLPQYDATTKPPSTAWQKSTTPQPSAPFIPPPSMNPSWSPTTPSPTTPEPTTPKPTTPAPTTPAPTTPEPTTPAPTTPAPTTPYPTTPEPTTPTPTTPEPTTPAPTTPAPTTSEPTPTPTRSPAAAFRTPTQSPSVWQRSTAEPTRSPQQPFIRSPTQSPIPFIPVPPLPTQSPTPGFGILTLSPTTNPIPLVPAPQVPTQSPSITKVPTSTPKKCNCNGDKQRSGSWGNRRGLRGGKKNKGGSWNKGKGKGGKKKHGGSWNNGDSYSDSYSSSFEEECDYGYKCVKENRYNECGICIKDYGESQY